jgi:mono/diheme cytochrome c family protein
MLYGVLLTLVTALVGGLAVMFSGVYNVAAGTDHTAVVYWGLEQGMRASVRRHAADVRVPGNLDEAALRKGAHCFDANCVQCHGAPGKSPADIGKGLSPAASSLTQTARDWPLEHIYWVTRNGIRMAGMPAWEFRLDDEELWSIAAFVDRELPRLTVAQYRERVAAAAGESCRQPGTRAAPDAERGLTTIRQYGCHGCHIIPGITGPDVHVGPSLAAFGKRPLIAGTIPNTPENLVSWLRAPQSLRPQSLMPDLGVTEQHARDMHAYLATLE